jgi:hypothetical protein
LALLFRSSGFIAPRIPQNQKIGKPNNLKSLGAIKPKDLNRIAKFWEQ